MHRIDNATYLNVSKILNSIPFGSEGLIGFVMRQTSLAQGPPLPPLHLLDLPYFLKPLKLTAAAHQPPCWMANRTIFLCLATWQHLLMALVLRWQFPRILGSEPSNCGIALLLVSRQHPIWVQAEKGGMKKHERPWDTPHEPSKQTITCARQGRVIRCN